LRLAAIKIHECLFFNDEQVGWTRCTYGRVRQGKWAVGQLQLAEMREMGDVCEYRTTFANYHRPATCGKTTMKQKHFNPTIT